MAKVLIVGSGPGALEACLALSRSEHLPDLEISLISPQTEFVYRPNVVVEPFGGQEPSRYNVGEIIAGSNTQQWLGTIDRVDPGAKKAWSPEGDEFDFDAIIIATGTEQRADLPEPAITFGGPAAMDEFKALVADVDAGVVHNIVFTAAEGRFWSLPLYELALMTASRAESQSVSQISVSIITPEHEPLQVFGSENAARVLSLLTQFGVTVQLESAVSLWDGHTLVTADGENHQVDRVFAMPKLFGRAPNGLPRVDDGFVPVDHHQQVLGPDGPLAGIYAVGDVTNFPIKQGGLASEEADVAVAAIEAELAGGPVPAPFSGEIQAILLTAETRMVMRARIGEDGSESLPTPELDGPEQKIYSRLLGDRLRELDAI